jgi:hypothetical protein
VSLDGDRSEYHSDKQFEEASAIQAGLSQDAPLERYDELFARQNTLIRESLTFYSPIIFTRTRFLRLPSNSP